MAIWSYKPAACGGIARARGEPLGGNTGAWEATVPRALQGVGHGVVTGRVGGCVKGGARGATKGAAGWHGGTRGAHGAGARRAK